MESFNGSHIGQNQTLLQLVNSTVAPQSGTGHIDPQDHYKYVVTAFGLLTFICGITGNSLVIFILLRYKDVRITSVSNYYILNLAISDLMFIASLPFFAYSSFIGDWVFGNPSCKIMFILREINKFANIFTLVALSGDRFLASFHNYGHLRTIRVGKIVCLIIWVLALAMITPYAMYAYSVSSSRGESCRLNWPSPPIIHKRAWIYSQVSLGLFVPFVLIVTSYILLMRRLRAIMKPRGADRIRKPNRKMTRTILSVVVVFLSCQVGLNHLKCI